MIITKTPPYSSSACQWRFPSIVFSLGFIKNTIPWPLEPNPPTRPLIMKVPSPGVPASRPRPWPRPWWSRYSRGSRGPRAASGPGRPAGCSHLWAPGSDWWRPATPGPGLGWSCWYSVGWRHTPSDPARSPWWPPPGAWWRPRRSWSAPSTAGRWAGPWGWPPAVWPTGPCGTPHLPVGRRLNGWGPGPSWPGGREIKWFVREDVKI